MKQAEIERVIEKGATLVSEVAGLKAYLWFPFLHSALVWATRRVAAWKDHILSWQVWIEPGIVAAKPDAYVFGFFEKDTGLNEEYAAEIQQRNMAVLREAFAALYPICGLEDPFLQVLFMEELKKRDFRRIVSEFEARTVKARTDLEPMKDKAQVLSDLAVLGEELVSLGGHFLSDDDLQRLILKHLKTNKKN